jgi:hypothetical protein
VQQEPPSGDFIVFGLELSLTRPQISCGWLRRLFDECEIGVQCRKHPRRPAKVQCRICRDKRGTWLVVRVRLAAARASVRGTLHFLVDAPGYEPLVTHVFIDGDEYLDSDAVFGVKDELIATIEHHTDPVMPDGAPASGPWHMMRYEFRMTPGRGAVPQPMMPAAE